MPEGAKFGSIVPVEAMARHVFFACHYLMHIDTRIVATVCHGALTAMLERTAVTTGHAPHAATSGAGA